MKKKKKKKKKWIQVCKIDFRCDSLPMPSPSLVNLVISFADAKFRNTDCVGDTDCVCGFRFKMASNCDLKTKSLCNRLHPTHLDRTFWADCRFRTRRLIMVCIFCHAPSSFVNIHKSYSEKGHHLCITRILELRVLFRVKFDLKI